MDQQRRPKMRHDTMPEIETVLPACPQCGGPAKVVGYYGLKRIRYHWCEPCRLKFRSRERPWDPPIGSR